MAKQVNEILSHWYTLIEGLQESSQDFYSSIERSVENRNLPDTKLSRVTYKEGGMFSYKREYCRVQKNDLIFDICAAPFGNGFFVSWWLGVSFGILQAFQKDTYYKIDVALMFQESVRNSVLEVIDELTKAKGLRSLTESERKPSLSNLFQG